MKKIYYVTKDEPGFIRKLERRKFVYFHGGKKVSHQGHLERIRALRIPPAYVDVWICTKPNGHIQAYGFDDLGRKQYIYHAHWTQSQSKSKFNHLSTFGKALRKLRLQVTKALKKNTWSKEKVLALVVKLLDATAIRIGSPQYHSVGLLTIRKKHLTIEGQRVYLDFAGKSKQDWHLQINDPSLVRLLKRCEKLPGNHLFKYYDTEEKLHQIRVGEVNDYLKQLTGEEITAKEFRTWKASVTYLHYIQQYDDSLSEAAQRACIDKVAKVMVNTPRVCKNSYIHPLLFKLRIKPLRSNTLVATENYLLRLLLKN